VKSRLLGVAVVAIALVGCGAGEPTAADPPREAGAESPPLRIRELRASVVRMGSMNGQPLLGVRLRAATCARSNAEGDRLLPISFRVAHYVTSRPRSRRWGRPFRVMSNDMYWIVTFGETRGTCGEIELEDVIPPANYGGVESALGFLRSRCYGVHLTIRAVLLGGGDRHLKPFSAGRRAIVQCARFGPR
jgi:hypothetical protein